MYRHRRRTAFRTLRSARNLKTAGSSSPHPRAPPSPTRVPFVRRRDRCGRGGGGEGAPSPFRSLCVPSPKGSPAVFLPLRRRRGCTLLAFFSLTHPPLPPYHGRLNVVGLLLYCRVAGRNRGGNNGFYVPTRPRVANGRRDIGTTFRSSDLRYFYCPEKSRQTVFVSVPSSGVSGHAGTVVRTRACTAANFEGRQVSLRPVEENINRA